VGQFGGERSDQVRLGLATVCGEGGQTQRSSVASWSVIALLPRPGTSRVTASCSASAEAVTAVTVGVAYRLPTIDRLRLAHDASARISLPHHPSDGRAGQIQNLCDLVGGVRIRVEVSLGTGCQCGLGRGEAGAGLRQLLPDSGDPRGDGVKRVSRVRTGRHRVSGSRDCRDAGHCTNPICFATSPMGQAARVGRPAG
jgi:hypothetical protein